MPRGTGSNGGAIVTDETAFLTAILATPEDDTVRLVFADWLEEHEQGDRARMIRWMVETQVPFTRDENGRWRNPSKQGVSVPGGWFWRGLNGFLSEPLPRPFVVTRGFVSQVTFPTLATFRQHAGEVFAAQPVTRVVVGECQPAHLESKGDHFWTLDVIPDYHPTPQHYLPPELWNALDGHDTSPSARTRARRYWTRDAALDALSRVLVTMGRARATAPMV